MDSKSHRLLEKTSRTFLIPIMGMPEQLKDAVGSAYLCLRAIDEIEDHDALTNADKIELLTGIASIFRRVDAPLSGEALAKLLEPHSAELPEVSISIFEVAELAPVEIRPTILLTTADMAEAMAGWVRRGWRIGTEADLDEYTFDVAGRVGLLLSEIWRWSDAVDTDAELAVGFGRALQAVNIVRNRAEDLERGADFFPDGWDPSQLIAYARHKITLADEYMQLLPAGAIHDFCAIPLVLAKATLDAVEDGRQKLSREDVLNLVSSLDLT